MPMRWRHKRDKGFKEIQQKNGGYAVSNKITGKEYPLDKIFSSDFEYHIPVYQRPYAWTKDETGKLFDDLYDFFCTRSAENYFLGSIVMIKDRIRAPTPPLLF